MYTVYILKSFKLEKYYTGCTNNIDERLERHNAGRCQYTKKYIPWKIHYQEKFEDRREAFKREKYLKSHAGRKWVKDIMGG